jgi:uncharacterized membrane protein
VTPQKKPPSEEAVSALEERAALLEKERDEYLADLKRIAADFENYRKRSGGGGGEGGGGGGGGGGLGGGGGGGV